MEELCFHLFVQYVTRRKMNLLKKQEAWELVSLLGGIPILCPSLI